MTPNKKKENANKIKSAIDELWGEYIVNTTILSTVCRQLAFGEGAVCWFFKNSSGNLPIDIKNILLFLVLYFISDVLQYLTSTIIYWNYAKFYEYKNNKQFLKNEDDITKPEWINAPSRAFFILKIFFLGIASFLLIGYFVYH